MSIIKTVGFGYRTSGIATTPIVQTPTSWGLRMVEFSYLFLKGVLAAKPMMFPIGSAYPADFIDI